LAKQRPKPKEPGTVAADGVNVKKRKSKRWKTRWKDSSTKNSLPNNNSHNPLSRVSRSQVFRSRSLELYPVWAMREFLLPL
jgi:hypothetical protein